MSKFGFRVAMCGGLWTISSLFSIMIWMILGVSGLGTFPPPILAFLVIPGLGAMVVGTFMVVWE